MLEQRFINKCSGSLPRAGLHGRKALLQADGGGTAVVDQPRRHHWGRPAPSGGESTRRDFREVLRLAPGCSNGGALRHRRYPPSRNLSAPIPAPPHRPPWKLIFPLMLQSTASPKHRPASPSIDALVPSFGIPLDCFLGASSNLAVP